MRSTAPSSEIDPLARILAVLCTAIAETPERIDDGIWRWTARHRDFVSTGYPHGPGMNFTRMVIAF